MQQCTTFENDTQVDAKVIDGPAAVQLLSPSGNKTFCDYAVDVFMPFIDLSVESVHRWSEIYILYGMWTVLRMVFFESRSIRGQD